MNADFYFETGSGKSICQDYATAGMHKDTAYAIGSDGCSSSPNTDIGSRILSLVSRHVGVSQWRTEDKLDMNEKIVRCLIVDRCKHLWKQLHIPADSFDATLWMAIWKKGKDPSVLGWGDGVIIADYGNYKIIFSHDYPYNAPMYLSYEFDTRRKEEHKRLYGEQYSVVTITKVYPDYTVEEISKIELGWGESIRKTFNGENLLSLSVCSDGIHTYMDHSNTPIPMVEIARDFTAYKSYVGEFVKRRMKKLSKEISRAESKHYDDVFCATIARG